MGQPQESIPKWRDEEERPRKKEPVRGIRRLVYAGIVAALGVMSGIGYGRNDSPAKKVEVSGPGGGPVPIGIHHGEKIPPEIQALLGENAVRLQHPVTVQYGGDIFMVDRDGRRLWKLVADNRHLRSRDTVDRPFIHGGVAYGTRATVKYGEGILEQITVHGIRTGPNGQLFVDSRFNRVWQLADVTLDELKTRVEEKKKRQRDQKKQEIVREQKSRLMQIVKISGKTFEDQRGVVWTYSGGYFPSLSNGIIIYDATMRVENPQWGRDARGSDILIGGTQILRWRVEGRGHVEFRAPVERKNKEPENPRRKKADYGPSFRA